MSQSYLIDWSVTYNREARAEEAITALKLSGHDPKEGLLLDLGCGAGSTTKWFANNLDIYSVGIEISKSFVGSTKNHVQSLNYIQASGVNLPFQEKIFHTVILNDVLEHISYQNATEAFKQIRKVLKDNGLLYVSVASKFEVREPHSNLLLISWFPRWIYAPIVRKIFHDDVYPYTARSFHKLAQQTGFTFENVTCLYVNKKVQNLNYIGNIILRPIVRVLNKIGLTKSAGFLKFMEPFGVLVFICQKTKQ